MSQERLLLFGTGFVAENYYQHLKLAENKPLVKVIYNKHKLHDDTQSPEHLQMGNSQLKSFLTSYKPTQILCLHGNSFVPTSTKVRHSIEDNALKSMDFLETISHLNLNRYV